MAADGLQVYICTSPVLLSKFCSQEKLNWVEKYLGDYWVHKVILSNDKSLVRGDILIDDKPLDYLTPHGKHTAAAWKVVSRTNTKFSCQYHVFQQIIFDAPYNQEDTNPRLTHWNNWREVVWSQLGRYHALDRLHYTEPYSPELSHNIAESKNLSNQDISVEKNLYPTPQQLQDIFLGPREPLSPEESACLKGSGSLLEEDADLQVENPKPTKPPTMASHCREKAMAIDRSPSNLSMLLPPYAPPSNHVLPEHVIHLFMISIMFLTIIVCLIAGASSGIQLLGRENDFQISNCVSGLEIEAPFFSFSSSNANESFNTREKRSSSCR